MSIEVHIDWQGQTHPVGRLHPSGSSYTFEYSTQWLKRDDAFAIDPTALPLKPGAHHSGTLFGALRDCGPDRWGRVLIERAVRKKILLQKPYREIDYVLALDDASRLGALRFCSDTGGPFLATASGILPPLVRLSALLSATDAIHGEKETAQELRFLLGAGSPLGGARPKAAVCLDDQRLGIAKFPKPDDTRDIAAGEILALELAERAGIKTAGHRLISLGRQSVAVITRFDRAEELRIPFISAASLLGLPLGGTGTYTQMSEGIRRFGGHVSSELRELWRRLVFSLLASNYDDHPRNHGFLMHEPGRWSLSPAYDLNPVPDIDRIHVSKTPITEDEEEPSIGLALEVSARFGLNAAEAGKILREVFEAVSAWRATGRGLGLKKIALDVYASAFEQPLMDEARRIVGK